MSDKLMHFTSIDPPKMGTKARESAEIAQHIAEFQAQGGQIQHLPSGMVSIDYGRKYLKYDNVNLSRRFRGL